MLQTIKAYVWQGNRKYFLLTAAVVAVGVMLYFGENVEWIAE